MVRATFWSGKENKTNTSSQLGDQVQYRKKRRFGSTVILSIDEERRFSGKIFIPSLIRYFIPVIGSLLV
jgi:hypothetical protein